MEVQYKLTGKGKKRMKRISLFRWLTSGEEDVLRILKGRQAFGLTRGKLAEMTAYSKGEISRILRSLRNEGIIESQVTQLPIEKAQPMRIRERHSASSLGRRPTPRITPKTPRLRR